MHHLTRRVFFQRLFVLTGSGSIILGCGGQRDSDLIESTTEPTVLGQSNLSCRDVSGLTEAEAAMRTTLQYSDQSPQEGKNCENCALYIVPDSRDDCGGCLSIKGPIHPMGYCTIWTVRAA